MSWSSGSELMDSVIKALKPVKDAKVRKVVYATLIPAFESMDCDTLDECKGLDDAFDAALLDTRMSDPDFVSFCITGTLSRSRADWIQDIEDYGYTYCSQVRKGLTYLVMAEPNLRTTKSDRAAKLGVKCIGEDELADLING